MHSVLSIVAGSFLALAGWISDLASFFASLAGHPLSHGDFVLANIVGTSVIIAIACIAWALSGRVRIAAAQRALNAKLARAQGEIRFREAMIAACPEAVAVLGSDMEAPLSYRGGAALLQSCLGGPQAMRLAERLEGLLQSGAAFALTVSTAGHRNVTVRGCPVGARAAVFLRVEDPSEHSGLDYRQALDVLPVPVWVRGRNLALTWANHAYLGATGAGTLEDARESQAALVRTEQDLARAASEGHEIAGAKRYATVGGERRAFALNFARLPDASVVGSALDITDEAHAESQLALTRDAQQDLLDHVEDAVAVFGPDRRLISCNGACRMLWSLEGAWLDSRPFHGEVLDRLRETRRVPEQRDFAAWKARQADLFGGSGESFAETWHLADGTSIAVRAYPDLLGGVYYLFNDITQRLHLEANYNMLAQVQRATLDTLDDGMAIFGPDGKLQLHNEAFARMWNLQEGELGGEPHLLRVADLCAERNGHDVVWKIVSAAVNSSEPARFNEWSKVVPTADGRALSLSLSRLPLGATLVAFADLTDYRRFEAELRPANEGAAVA